MAATTTNHNVNTACPPSSGGESLTYSPRFDVGETADELILYGDLPGVLPEDLDIRYENGQLLVRGQVRSRHSGRYLCGEYGVGDYERSFQVGDAFDPEQIRAELKHGVLILRLPKSSRVKPRKIEVAS